MPDSIYLDGSWCGYTSNQQIDEITYNMILDNMIYFINNSFLSKKFKNIIVGWQFKDIKVIEDVICHLKVSDVQLSIFDLNNTDDLEIENFELANLEYQSHYYTLETTGQLVKISSIDTTEISAFKIAHTISKIINC